MLEIWKTVIAKGETYDNYQVSNLGRIMSLNYRNTGKAELMELSEDTDGYLVVGLSKNGKTDTCKVHRLVAEIFLPNPLNKPQVNHKIDTKEGKKINIVYINEDGSINKEKTTIEWVTAKENINYGTCIQRRAKTNTNGKKSKPVLQFTLDGEFVREWPSTMECGRNGFKHSGVGACCRGKLPHYKGFKWQYA